jgi:hypothetical protein
MPQNATQVTHVHSFPNVPHFRGISVSLVHIIHPHTHPATLTVSTCLACTADCPAACPAYVLPHPTQVPSLISLHTPHISNARPPLYTLQSFLVTLVLVPMLSITLVLIYVLHYIRSKQPPIRDTLLTRGRYKEIIPVQAWHIWGEWV